MENPYSLTVGAAESLVVNPFGDFQLIRPFIVTREAPGEARDGINGFIVQLIERTARVIAHRDGGDEELTTEGKISSFTSGKVRNAVGNYYELFIVEKGEVLDRDQFQGGQVLSYPIENPDDKIKTSGTITIKGTSVFVRSNPAKIAQAKAAMARSEAAGATRSSTRFRALGEAWDTFDGEPANGLPYLGSKISGVLELANSNRLVRTCTVTWSRDGKTTLEEITEPRSARVYKRSAAGGAIRGRSASKSYRKRGTGTARRRSSRRARVPRYRTVGRGSGTSR